MASSRGLYDRGLIDSNIRAFQQQGYNHSDVNIYFDMDNTLALFSPYGDTETAFRLMHSKGFYKELHCFQEAPAVLENLQNLGYNVFILSSCIESPYCKEEKSLWVDFHLPFIKKENVILIPNGTPKSEYIPNPERSILVDDFYSNLVDIYRSGGIGVKKTYTGKERPIPQVQSLVDIFGVLNFLNCL